MRISALKDDPGYRDDAYQFNIFLNGVKRTDCFTADEETGEVVAYTADENGNRVVDPETGALVLQTLTGTVVISRRDRL